MEYKKYLTESMIDNIYNEFPNSYVIKYNSIGSERYIGKLLLKVNIKKDKDININDFVDFKFDKVKWKNENICIVHPRWVKRYYNLKKLSVKLKIQKSRINTEDKREYYTDYENINLTYKQFIKRRLAEDYRKVPFIVMEAYSNFQQRRPSVGYWKALNETAKHYRIQHDILKNEIIPKINNSIKQYKDEWKKMYEQKIQEDSIQKSIDVFVEKNRTDGKVININENRNTKIIN